MAWKVGGMVFAILALLAGLPARATPLPPRGVFVYSDLCIEPQSDDWAGHRLVVVLLEGNTLVNYEWGGEGPLYGAAAVTSRFDHPSEQLEFHILSDEGKDRPPEQTTRGVISQENFVLKGEAAAITIPRQLDLNAKVPACKALPRK